MFKKLYLGARLQLRTRLGIAVGLYQGLPTYGLKLDLPFLKLGLTAYSKELGDYPGQRQRDLIMLALLLVFSQLIAVVRKFG